MKKLILALDGPAGSGKSTTAKMIAEKLGFIHIDTGAMYRAVTLKALRNNIPFENEDEIIRVSKEMDFTFEQGDDRSLRVIVDGEDVTEKVRDNEVSKYVSYPAKIKGVREELVRLQQKLAENLSCGVVMDGRDIGTVVLKDTADFKFFINASVKVRALRRQGELELRGEKVAVELLEEEIQRRDEIDSTRLESPLKKAFDAIEVDTSEMSREQVIEYLLNYIENKTGEK